MCHTLQHMLSGSRYTPVLVHIHDCGYMKILCLYRNLLFHNVYHISITFRYVKNWFWHVNDLDNVILLSQNFSGMYRFDSIWWRKFLNVGWYHATVRGTCQCASNYKTMHLTLTWCSILCSLVILCCIDISSNATFKYMFAQSWVFCKLSLNPTERHLDKVLLSKPPYLDTNNCWNQVSGVIVVATVTMFDFCWNFL